MSNMLLSTIGLLLCLAPVVVYAVGLVQPLWSRWVVNWILPVFGPGLPKPSKALSAKEQIAILEAALNVLPKDNRRNGQDHVFLILFEKRQGALGLIAVTIGVLHGLMLPVVDRHVQHVVFGVMAASFALVNANLAGFPLSGHHPELSRNGRYVGLVFAPYWP